MKNIKGLAKIIDGEKQIYLTADGVINPIEEFIAPKDKKIIENMFNVGWVNKEQFDAIHKNFVEKYPQFDDEDWMSFDELFYEYGGTKEEYIKDHPEDFKLRTSVSDSKKRLVKDNEAMQDEISKSFAKRYKK